MAKLDTETQPAPEQTAAKATKKHIRGSSILLVGRFIALFLNFAVQVLTVRYLSKNDYGAFAYTLSVVSMATSVSLFGLDKAVSRFIPIYQEQKQFGKMLGAILMTLGTIIGVGTSLVVLAYGLQGTLAQTVVNDPLSLALLLSVIALAPVQAVDNWFQGMFAVFASPKAIFFRRHLLGPGLKLTAVLVVLAVQGNVFMLAIGYLIGGVLGLSSYVTMLFHVLKEQGVWQQFKLREATFPFREIFSFSTPLLSTDIVQILKSSMIVVFLEFFRSPTDVAEFKAVLPVAGLNLVVLQSFKFLYTPLAARMFAHKDWKGINDLYWKTAVWITLFTFPVFAVTFSLAQPLTVLLYGDRYAQSGIILAILAFGNYFNAALGFNSYTLRVYGRVRYIVAIDFLSGLMSVGLALWLIPRYGALGAAISTTGTLIIYNLLKHLGLLKGTGIDLFQWRYLEVYLSILLAAGGLLAVQTMADFPLAVTLILALLVSLFVVRINRDRLDILEMFPELGRLPFIRPILGLK